MQDQVSTNSELIIREDGFYRRETFDIKLGPQDEILQQALGTRKEFYIAPLALPGLNEHIEEMWFGAYEEQSHSTIFHRIKGFPFVGLSLKAVSANQYQVHHQPLNDRYFTNYVRDYCNGKYGTFQEWARATSESGEYIFPEDQTFLWSDIRYPMFLMTSQFKRKEHLASEATPSRQIQIVHLFALRQKDGVTDEWEPFVPNLPNIYAESGKVCMGGYGDNPWTYDKNKPSDLRNIKRAVDHFFTANSNSDLWERSVMENVCFDKDKKPIQMTMHNGFFKPATDQRMIEFAKNYPRLNQ